MGAKKECPSWTTDYLFICDGSVLFIDDDSFTGYLGWEELRRIQAAHAATKKTAL